MFFSFARQQRRACAGTTIRAHGKERFPTNRAGEMPADAKGEVQTIGL
jgi:hypothetical protein